MPDDDEERKFVGGSDEAQSLIDSVVAAERRAQFDVDRSGADDQVVGVATGELYVPPQEAR